MSPPVTNPYDKIIKEVFAQSSFIQRLGEFEIKESLPELQFEPQTKYVDSLYLIYDRGSKKEKILHVEFQSSNDPTMPERMLDYFTLIKAKYSYPIIQCLFYVGLYPMTMKNFKAYEQFEYRYHLININDIALDDLLSTGTVGDTVLALLGDVGKRTNEEVIAMVLNKLQSLTDDKNTLSCYFKLVTLLGKLRKMDYLIKDEVQKIMIDINYKDSVIYQDGKIEGKIERDYEVARTMKTEGLGTDLIARVTGLSVDEIDKL